MFVYCIRNKEDGKRYIGQTVMDIRRRWSAHKHQAKTKPMGDLHRAIAAEGPDVFEVEFVVDAKSIQDMDRLEADYIEKFDTVNTGYNSIDGGGISKSRKKATAAKSRNRKIGFEYYIVVKPDGTEIRVDNISEFARKNKLSAQRLCTVANPKSEFYGYTAKRHYCYRNTDPNRTRVITHKAQRYLLFKDIDDKKIEIVGSEALTDFAEEHGLERSRLSTCHQETSLDYAYPVNGWYCMKADDEGFISKLRERQFNKLFVLISPSGDVYETYNLTEFGKTIGVAGTYLNMVSSKKAPEYGRTAKGWTCIKPSREVKP